MLSPGDSLLARRLARAPCGEVEIRPARAVGAELEAEEATGLDPLENHSTGAIPEDDAGGPVRPVDDLRENVSADNERVAPEPGREHRRRLRQGIHEAGATGGQVVGGSVVGT